jgi:hypothetical protein
VGARKHKGEIEVEIEVCSDYQPAGGVEAQPERERRRDNVEIVTRPGGGVQEVAIALSCSSWREQMEDKRTEDKSERVDDGVVDVRWPRRPSRGQWRASVGGNNDSTYLCLDNSNRLYYD